MRRVVVLLTLAVVLAGAAPAARQALPRAGADRPDDVVGAQIHLVYALPSDGVDRQLDTSGAIESSVASLQRWLASETNGRMLRIDTAQGAADVTFARLSRTDAEIASRGVFVRDELERLLRESGLISAQKVYAVYYDGSSTVSCGGGAWPPVLPGAVAAMYLHGRPPGAAPCDANALAAPGGAPGYIDYAMLHELLHTLGAVQSCAPHHHLAGHTSDRSDDIMWAGTGAWQVPGHLDPGHDDYYGHGRADCFDLARSEYLGSAAAEPQPPTAAKLTAGRISVGKATAGARFVVSLPVRLGAGAPPTARTRCTGRLGTGALLQARSSYARGRGTCVWKLPATSARRRITGSIRITVGTASIARTFGVRIAPRP